MDFKPRWLNCESKRGQVRQIQDAKLQKLYWNKFVCTYNIASCQVTIASLLWQRDAAYLTFQMQGI